MMLEQNYQSRFNRKLESILRKEYISHTFQEMLDYLKPLLMENLFLNTILNQTVLELMQH